MIFVNFSPFRINTDFSGTFLLNMSLYNDQRKKKNHDEMYNSYTVYSKR